MIKKETMPNELISLADKLTYSLIRYLHAHAVAEQRSGFELLERNLVNCSKALQNLAKISSTPVFDFSYRRETVVHRKHKETIKVATKETETVWYTTTIPCYREVPQTFVTGSVCKEVDVPYYEEDIVPIHGFCTRRMVRKTKKALFVNHEVITVSRMVRCENIKRFQWQRPIIEEVNRMVECIPHEEEIEVYGKDVKMLERALERIDTETLAGDLLQSGQLAMVETWNYLATLSPTGKVTSQDVFDCDCQRYVTRAVRNCLYGERSWQAHKQDPLPFTADSTVPLIVDDKGLTEESLLGFLRDNLSKGKADKVYATCVMLASGYTTSDIAVYLKSDIRTIQRYLADARRVLKDYSTAKTTLANYFDNIE